MAESRKLIIEEKKLSERKYFLIFYTLLLIDLLLLISLINVFDDAVFLLLAFVLMTGLSGYFLFLKKCKTFILDSNGIQVDGHLFLWKEISFIKYEYGIRSLFDAPSIPFELLHFQASQNKVRYCFTFYNVHDADVRKIDTDEFKEIKTKIEQVIACSKTSESYK